MAYKSTFTVSLKDNSIRFTIPFIIKVFFFHFVWLLLIFYNNIYFYLVTLLLAFIILYFIWFFRIYGQYFRRIWIFIITCSLFRILFSQVEGRILLERPRWSFISSNTIHKVIIVILKTLSILFSWILYISIISEDELMNFLIYIKLPKNIILTITIALNTFNYIMRDVDTTLTALESRQYKSNSIWKKIKKIYYIWGNIFLSHIKRIQTLNDSFHLNIKK